MPEKTSFQRQNFILASTKEQTLCLMHTDSRAEGMKQDLIGLNELEEDFQERADTYQVETFSMGQQQQN